jgi:hypothetical protein
MKNIFKTCCFLILSNVCVTQPVMAVDRNTVYFYGLGKTQNESTAYGNKFAAERKMDSKTDFNYVTRQTDRGGMQKVADDAYTETLLRLGAQSTDPNNIAIGHDIGGLIARSIYKNHGGTFGGIILTGTPNQDMVIVTNFINGRIQSEFTQTGLELAGDIKALFNFDGNNFGNISIAEIPIRWAQRQFGANPANIFASVNHLQRNSSFLRDVADAPRVNTITIRGNENDPAVWRYFSSINGRAIGAATEGSISNSDQDLVNIVNTAITDTRNQADIAALTGAFKVLGGVVALFTNPFAGAAAILSSINDFRTVNKLADKIGWLQDSRFIWNNLIGASREEIVTITNIGGMTPACTNGINANGWQWYWQTLSQEERTRCWINEVIQVRTLINEPSDGLLHATTQKLPNLAEDQQLEATEANHEELLNHPRVTERYTQIWEGEINTYFKTRTR